MDGNQMRPSRKDEHIQAVRELGETRSAGFEDVVLLPASASEVDWDEVSLETDFFGIRVGSPLLINAMTGGTETARAINARLARLAHRHRLAMAVGSQTAMLRQPELATTYTVVRDHNPNGMILANVGMGTAVEWAMRAVELVAAGALQVHWNTAQELFMPEGDRRFYGMLTQLRDVAQGVSVPVVAKEIGQGMTGRAARRFLDYGARAIDVGGRGGTNFMVVEAWRSGRALTDEWATWGLPTAVSLAEVLAAVPESVPVVASGGLRSGHDVAKSLAMGAQLCGIAGPLLRIAADGDEDRLDRWVTDVHDTLKTLMVLMGVRTIFELRQRPVVITGALGEWLQVRGANAFRERLARRC